MPGVFMHGDAIAPWVNCLTAVLRSPCPKELQVKGAEAVCHVFVCECVQCAVLWIEARCNLGMGVFA